MMRHARIGAILLILAAATPALASPCGEAIASLEGRVMDQTRTAISSSTSGKAAAGAREGQGSGGEAGAAAPAAAPAVAAQAGEGADKAMQAKVALDEARTADGKGDRAACEAAIERARGHLAAAP